MHSSPVTCVGWGSRQLIDDVSLSAVYVPYRSAAFCIDHPLSLCELRANAAWHHFVLNWQESWAGNPGKIFRMANTASYNRLSVFRVILHQKNTFVLRFLTSTFGHWGALKWYKKQQPTLWPKVPLLMIFLSWGRNGSDTDWWLTYRLQFWMYKNRHPQQMLHQREDNALTHTVKLIEEALDDLRGSRQ